MNFAEATRNYLDHLRIERGLAAHSIASYSRDLRKFEEFISNSHLNYETLTADDIISFTVFLKERGLSISSINRTLSGIKGFYKYLGQENGVENPTTDLPSAKLSRKLPKALTIEEISSLIDKAVKQGDSTTLRDGAILELLYSTGARVSEVIGLNVADFVLSKNENSEIHVVKVKGKGSKERLVPLGKFALSAVESYLTRVRPILASKNPKSESALFLNNRGKRLSRQSAWQAVLNAADAAGLQGRVSPHVLRHSFATHLLDGGADIRVVQELLGHSSVTTTQIYTLVTIDKVREAYSTAHPRARD